MRLALVLVSVLGCVDSDEFNAPDDCAAQELHLVQGSLDMRFSISNFAFINYLGNSPGTLDVGGSGPDKVHIEFGKLAARGDIVNASGNVKLASGLDAGNCESSNSRPGKLEVQEDMWRFVLTDLRTTDYCGGAAVDEPVTGCYRAR